MSEPFSKIGETLRGVVPPHDDNLPLDGVLTKKRPDGRIQFGFQYRGIPFVVSAHSKDDGTTRMSTVASLGVLPYTAENPSSRATALKIMDAAVGDLGGRIRLTDKQRIELIENIHLDVPLTPSVLLTRTAELVLQAKPYLELLACVVKPPIVDMNAVGTTPQNA